jgi:protease I
MFDERRALVQSMGDMSPKGSIAVTTTTDFAVADNRAAIRSTTRPSGRIAILTGDRVEDVEFFYPYYRFTEAGYDVDVLTPLAFVSDFAATGRLVGAVCHGPQVLISAGLADGRRMTSWRDVAPEVRAAGAEYVDEPVVEDGQFITARKPGDMPLELARFLERLAAEKNEGGSDE